MISTNRIRHKDVRYEVIYKEGNANQADHLSRYAVLLEKITEYQQTEIAKMNKLLFLLHTTPITNIIGIKTFIKKPNLAIV